MVGFRFVPSQFHFCYLKLPLSVYQAGLTWTGDRESWFYKKYSVHSVTFGFTIFPVSKLCLLVTVNSGSSVITPGRGSTAANDTPLWEDLSSALDHGDYTNETKQRRSCRLDLSDSNQKQFLCHQCCCHDHCQIARTGCLI